METKPVNYAELCQIAATLAQQAGALTQEIREDAVQEVQQKSSQTDLVTKADKAAEESIFSSLESLRPDDGIEGEEGSNKAGSSGVIWHIDPVDGTTNYVYGLDYAVSIGVSFEGNYVAGAVYNPVRDELYTASLGSGAFRNGKEISCSPVETLQTVLLATGFSYSSDDRRSEAEQLVSILPNVRDIRRIGVASLDLCYVASGQVDAYYENSVEVWDIAAGTVIAREAGAQVSTVAGDNPGQGSIVAANASIHREILRLVAVSSA